MEQLEEFIIRERSVDNRTVIEVKGKIIVLSNIKSSIEHLLTNSVVEEVRIYAGETLDVDANLSHDVWHGRNLVVLANEINVSATVTWDVSGKEGDHTYTSDAGTGVDGLGNNGSDGYPGESGGNVLVQASTIQNPERLTIISNGGNGSNGQDGGNGKDGVDGKGIAVTEFEDRFPHCLKVLRGTRIDKVTQIVRNIYDESKSLKIQWMKKKSFCGSGDITNSLVDHLSDRYVFDIYLNVVTHKGNEIFFSLRDRTFKCDSFLLYKGSPGEPGKSGGGYGMGGQGGFPGEITVMGLSGDVTFDVCSHKNWGNDGTNGEGGPNGRYGKNGWDMGFFGQSWTEPTIYGRDQNSKLELSFHEESSSDNIYHPYMAKHSDCNKYVTIDEANVEHPSANNERNKTCARNERAHHAKASGKKSIPRTSIHAAFSEYLQEIEKERQEIVYQRIELERQFLANQQLIEYEEYDALQQDVDNRYTDLNDITDLDIKHFLNYSTDTSNQNQFEVVKLKNLNENVSHKNNTSTILERSFNVDDWLQLQSQIIDFDQLVTLVKHFKSSKPRLSLFYGKDYRLIIKTIAETLKMKYKFSILGKIAQKQPVYHEEFNKIILTAQKAARYLEVTAEQNGPFGHPVLGRLKEYIFKNTPEQRAKFVEYVKTSLKSSDNGLKQAIEAYILGIDETKIEDERLRQFYDDYHKFVKEHRNKINSKTITLPVEFKMSKHKETLRLWNDRFDDDVELEDLEKKLKNGKTLRSLYDQLTREKNAEYHWEKCCADEQIQEIFMAHLEEEGIMSKSYRVLLAYVYGVNIRVYAGDEENELALLEDHNPKSTIATHILLKANELIQLKKNDAYCELEEERLHKDQIYGQILAQVSAMQRIKIIKRYFEKELYNQTTYNWVEKSEEFDEEVAIEKIAAFFPDEERELISQRLKSISAQYTGQQGVFESLLERFSFEGRHVSFNELCFLINSILSHTVEARQEKNTFSWIISAYSQCNWTDELVLLQLENFFKKQIQNKAEWREYMSNIHNKGVLLVFVAQLARKPCSAECVEDILHMVSNVPIDSICLEELELTECPYLLKEHYWTIKLQSLTTWNDFDNLKSSTYFILSIENNQGKDKLEKMFETLTGNRHGLTASWLNAILKKIHTQKWILDDDDLDILREKSFTLWENHMDEKYKISFEELNVSQIATIIAGNANTSQAIKDHVSRIQVLVENIKQLRTRFNEKQISSFTTDDVKLWSKTFRNTETDSSLEMYELVLAVIDRAVELRRGFKLRDTQRLTVLALLTNKNKSLAQVATGEGKSLIVVATAVIKGLLGEKVDIITSSSVLAQRDASDHRDIYELFGLSASHNCSENMEERKNAYSCNQIMYGDLANFQRDYLLDRFYGKHVLGDRSFENVIVDEVDSMLLDKGNNMLYLSHDIAGMDKLESVYVFIWQMVNTLTDITEDEAVETIKRSVLSNMYPSILIEDIGSLEKTFEESKMLALWERLVMSGIMSDSGRLFTKEIDSIKLQEALSPDFTHYKDRLNFLLLSRVEQESYVKVPNYLKPFVERHLDSWISSALTALYMVPGQYYVVDVDRSGTSADRHPNVIIIDRDTGTDQVSSQWDEALHQFLQLKHNCKLSTQNLKAVFISNVTYLKMYKLLYGLTGTLGSQRERHLLKEIHQVDFVTIPTAKPKQFEEQDPIICSSKEDWRLCIRQEVNKMIKTDKRSVLIICETISEVDSLKQKLSSGNHTNVHTYLRDYEKFTIHEGGLKPGQILIATNLAGRGTDIKISNELREAGGLHVILTFLPANIRIEEQAFGRAARSGDKGSGRMIITVADGETHNRSLIFTLKQKRNVEELFRITAIKSYYETIITLEEDCLKVFTELLGKKMKCLANADTPETVEEILLQSCLDRWSFWLDENNALIGRSSDEATKRQVKQVLDQFIAHLNNLEATDAISWPAWVEGNPIQMIKLGKYLCHNKVMLYQTALRLFGNVIENEPYFCDAAYYYRAYTQSLTTMNFDEIEKDLRMAERLFEEHIKSAMLASGVVLKLKDSTLQDVGYEEQKKNIINLYSLFIQSIDDMLGHAIAPESFVNYDINEDVARKVFDELLQIGMITRPQVRGNITKAQLQKLHFEYGISVRCLSDFLSSNVGTISEEEFLGALRKSFTIPSRSEFWEALVKQNVLYSVEEYVTINDECLKMEEPELMNFIKEKVDIGDLSKEMLNLELGQVLLIHEHHSTEYFDKAILIDLIGVAKYKLMENKGLVSCNKKATLNKSQIADCVFADFDSITVQDIMSKTRITAIEANNIIEELTNQKVLEKRGNSFALSVNHDQDILLPTYPVYENVIRSILASCFAYRLALKNISLQLEDEACSIIRIDLQPDPHRMLFNDLLEQKITKPPTLNVTMNVDVAVEKLFENQMFSKYRGATHHIKNVLNRSKPTLVTLEAPEANLKSIFEFYGKGNFGNIAEMRIFITNGLEHLLELTEKKWTLQMISSTTAVVCIGLAQIAIGAILEVSSVGLAPVAGAFFGEGVSDIIFAVKAAISGEFSWKDYGKHKCKNILSKVWKAYEDSFSATEEKVPVAGYKVAGPGLQYGGQFITKSTGTQLINFVGRKTALRGTVKCEALKTAKGVSFAVDNMDVDKRVANHLQSILNSIKSDVLVGVQEEVANHKVKHSLQKAYSTLGESKAKVLVNDLTNTYLMEQNTKLIYFNHTKQLQESMTQGLSKTFVKLKSNNAMALTSMLSKVTETANTVEHLSNMRSDTKVLLDTMHAVMDEMLAKLEQHSALSKEEQVNGREGKRFQREVMEQWGSILTKQIGQLLAQHVVLPALKTGVEGAITYTGKALTDIQLSTIDLPRDTYRLKNKQEQKTDRPDMIAETKRQLTEKYHGQLLNIMHKTRSPALFASIIRENVPMDMACACACAPVVHKMLQGRNSAITGLTITVHGDDGLKHSVSCGEGGPEIHLYLLNNHFTVSRMDGAAEGRSENNCLYGALATGVPDLQTIGQETFRNWLSEEVIEDNKTMHHQIQQPWYHVKTWCCCSGK